MWKFIPIPKGIALLAFLLPWMTISCSGQEIAKANGLELTLGNIQKSGQLAAQGAAEGSGGEINYWLVAAVLLIIIGMVLAFVLKRKSAIATLITSIAAIVLIYAGTYSYSESSLRAEMEKEQAASAPSSMGDSGIDTKQMQEAALNMIQIEWQFGYWLTMLALIAAAAMSGVALAGRDVTISTKRKTEDSGPDPS